MTRMLHFFWFNYHKREGDERVYHTSNYEIQKWAEKCLGKHFTVHSTSCVTQGRVTVAKDDILLGHLSWDPEADPSGGAPKSQRNWVYDNRLHSGDLCHPHTCILTPWVPVFPPEWTDHMPFYESQLEQARIILGICGPIWLRETLALNDGTVQSRVKDKVVQLDMCINMDALQIRKGAFNAVGKRKVIHVSNLDSYKGFDLLLDSTKGVTVPGIGSKKMAGVDRGTIQIEAYGSQYTINNLGAVNNRDDAQIRTLVDEHDFYIHTSSMDAQATTILEFGARGLVPIVTPESGFECDGAIYLTRYAAQNREIVAKALAMRDEELNHRREQVMGQLARNHSWHRMFDTIAAKLNEDCPG
jgi:glycosyltransferase involved in cell wall biosynthesis